jgi:2-polyprenyl-3-methyl-5-hydroxy-6-metoxy-1,4-benzoquinol methylase
MSRTVEDDALATFAYELSFRGRYAYAEAAALHCAVRLGMLDFLPVEGEGSASAGDVAAAVGASARGVRVVLEALTGSGALARDDGGGFALRAAHARALAAPGLRAELAEDLDWWGPVGRLVEALRSGGQIDHDGRAYDVLARYARLFAPGAAPDASPEAYWRHRGGRAFMETQALIAAGELGILDAVRAGPVPAATLTRSSATDGRALEVLLDVLVELAVVERSGAGYELTALARETLDERSLRAFVASLPIAASFWEALGRLHEAVIRDEPMLDLNEPATSARFYLDLARYNTAVLSSYVAQIREIPARVAQTRDLTGARVLDVGAGSGVWGSVFARMQPVAQVTFCDREDVLGQTRLVAERLGITERASYLAGDFHEVAFEAGAYDVAILGQICHTQHPATLPLLVRRVGESLREGGVLVLADFVLDETRDGPLEYLLFGVKEFVSTQGEVLTKSQYMAIFEGAGLMPAGFERRRGIEILLATRGAARKPSASAIGARETIA